MSAGMSRESGPEVDGRQHDRSAAQEDARKFSKGKGDRVLRYWNNDVPLSVEGVLEDILSAITTTPTPHPLPTRGRGADRVAGKRAPSRAGCAHRDYLPFAGNHRGNAKVPRKDQRTSPPQKRIHIACEGAASEHGRVGSVVAIQYPGRPRAGHDQVRGDWFIDQPSGEQRRGNRITVIVLATRVGVARSSARHQRTNASAPPPIPR